MYQSNIQIYIQGSGPLLPFITPKETGIDINMVSDKMPHICDGGLPQTP